MTTSGLLLRTTIVLAVWSAPEKAAALGSKAPRHRVVQTQLEARRDAVWKEVPTQLRSPTAAALGCWGTFAMCRHWGLGSVPGSGAVGLAAAALMPAPLATAAFCGSFAGMSGSAVLRSQAEALALGACAGLAFDRAARVFVGKGGRLGFLAVLSAISWQCVLQRGLPDFGAPFVGVALPDLVAGALGALVVRAATKRFGQPVRSAALVGLAGALLPTAIQPTLYAGAFVGMSQPAALPTPLAAARAGAAAALFATCIGLSGCGGRLGAAALGAVLADGFVRRLFGGLLSPGARTTAF